jgi:DNA-binding NarL/FixJ family response regulator
MNGRVANLLMTNEVKILIADDHPIFRNGLAQLLRTVPNFTVTAEAADGEAALACLQHTAFDVAILDLDMPEKDGFEVARTIAEKGLPIAVIILTMHKNEALFNAALNLGVKGYVLKDSALADIINAIKAVMRGEEFISPTLSAFLFNRSRRAASLVQHKPTLNDLTDTERRVLKLIGQYKTSKEIADELFISKRTVDRHRANIADKLGLKGSHAVLKFALDHKDDLF